MWDRFRSIPFMYIWGTLGTLQPVLGMEEWPLMMQTSTAHTFLSKLIIHCPKSHRSDPCHLPRGRFFGLEFRLSGFFHPPSWTKNSWSQVRCKCWDSQFFPFPLFCPADPRCREMQNVYFNSSAKLFSTEPCMAPLRTLTASNKLLKRFWILVGSSLLLKADPAMPTAMHTSFCEQNTAVQGWSKLASYRNSLTRQS